MKEKQRHQDAFEIYFQKKQEGHSVVDTIMTVMSQCNVSEKTVYRWKSFFDWDGREAIRAAEIQKEVEKRSDNSIIENKSRYLSYNHALLNQFQKDFEEGSVKIKNITDFKNVIQLALLLQGERNEITEIEAKIKIDQEQRVRNIQDTLKKLKRKEE
ncbi:MAG: hypothetical protein DDT40_01455 [candidate division WS2 bacterium]|nr:hypothetical protein [Candidatus Psychracetigena formicireducens]